MTKLIKRSWNWSLSASVLGIALILIWVVPVGAQINQNFGNPGGSGTVSGQAPHAISVGTGATTVGSTAGTPPSTNGQYTCGYTVTGSAAVDPTCPLVGLSASTISGTTTTYTVLYSDVAAGLIVHDQAASGTVAITLPTPTTLGNTNAVFVYTNHSAQTDTITPTTWTIQSNTSAAGASLSVGPGVSTRISVDPFNATNWIADTLSSAAYAPLASPTFTGTPAAPTAAFGTSTTQLATTAFVGKAAYPSLTAYPTNTLTTGTTGYASPGQTNSFNTTESLRTVAYPRSGTISMLSVCTNTTQTGGTAVITYRLGSAWPATGLAGTTLTVTIGSGATAECVTDSTHSFAYTAGLPIDIQVVNNGSGASAVFYVIYAEFTNAN